MTQIIHLHREAPPKPPLHAPCNGCGVCCASEPCPLGRVVSRKRRGACRALRWHAAALRYECGLLVAAADYLPRPLRFFAPWMQRLAARYIGLNLGCDADLVVMPNGAPVAPASPAPDHLHK